MVCVAAIWVGAGVLVQWLFAKDESPRPFFLTYVCVSEFVVLLPLRAARESKLQAQACARCPAPAPRTDWKAAFRAALVVCPVWFIAQGTYNWSLLGTTVSSSTVLSATSCVWTLLFSTLLMRQEAFSWWKVAGVALTLAGAGLVSWNDSFGGGGDASSAVAAAVAAAAAGSGPHLGSGERASNPSSALLGDGSLALPPPWGDVLTLISALAYGLYTTLIRWTMPSDGSVDISVFFGWLGLSNSVLLLPVVVGLHLGGVEPLGDVTAVFIGWVLIKGLFDNVISDLLWARAIVLAGPTMATVGLSLTIPLAMLSDAAIHALFPSPLTLCGSVAVLAGFIMTTLATGTQDKPHVTPGPGRPAAAGDAVATLRRGSGSPSAPVHGPLEQGVGAG